MISVKILSEFSSVDWNDIPEDTKSIISSLIRMPTVSNLSFQAIHRFPIAALSVCSGLNDVLFIDCFGITPPGDNDTMHSLSIKSLVLWHGNDNLNYSTTLAALMSPIGGSNTTTAGSIIEFDQLQHASVAITDHDEFFQMCKLMERSIFLESLTITGNCSLFSVYAYPDEVWNSLSQL